MHSDHYVFDDEKHRAMHEDLNRQSGGLFSSESEIYQQSHDHSSSSGSSKNGGKWQRSIPEIGGTRVFTSHPFRPLEMFPFSVLSILKRFFRCSSFAYVDFVLSSLSNIPILYLNVEY